MQRGELDGEHGVQYASFVVRGKPLGREVGAQRVHAGLELIGRTAFKRFLSALLHGELEHIGVDRASFSLSAMFCSFSWLRKFESMPPGT